MALSEPGPQSGRNSEELKGLFLLVAIPTPFWLAVAAAQQQLWDYLTAACNGEPTRYTGEEDAGVLGFV